jgi:hypothetical protein
MQPRGQAPGETPETTGCNITRPLRMDFPACSRESKKGAVSFLQLDGPSLLNIFNIECHIEPDIFLIIQSLYFGMQVESASPRYEGRSLEQREQDCRQQDDSSKKTNQRRVLG